MPKKKLIAQVIKSQKGFTLVELLVVVTIIVALTAVSFVSVTQFAGKGTTGATSSERDNVQTAMDTMMGDKGINAVTPKSTTGDAAVQDFTSVPTEGALKTYLRTNPTRYWYCWDSSGKIKQLTAAGNCPVGPY